MNYETLKHVKEDLNKWRDIYCPWMEMLDIVKIPVFPKYIYNFSENLLKIQVGFLWNS